MFFPDDEDSFASGIQEMNTQICDASGVAVFDFFFDEGTVDDYLEKNGLYPSHFSFIHSPGIFQEMNSKAVSLWYLWSHDVR